MSAKFPCVVGTILLWINDGHRGLETEYTYWRLGEYSSWDAVDFGASSLGTEGIGLAADLDTLEVSIDDLRAAVYRMRALLTWEKMTGRMDLTSAQQVLCRLRRIWDRSREEMVIGWRHCLGGRAPAGKLGGP